MKQILLVEDDAQITGLLSLHLHDPFYQVTACDKGATALEKIAVNPYHLVILDIMLPDVNGIEICRKIREDNSWTPILMLSSLSEETDKVLALELGADDYLTKPFGIFELMARTKALLRRGERERTGGRQHKTTDGSIDRSADASSENTNESPNIVRCRGLLIDKEKRKVSVRNSRLDLTPKEFDLLWLLASHPGKTFTRHELLELIWGFAFTEYEHTVTSHVNRLRIKLEKDLDKPEFILTAWGTGYRFSE